MNLLPSFRSELIKTRRTASIYLTLIAAAFVPFFSVMELVTDGISQENKVDPLNNLYQESFQALGILISPMFVILISTLLAQIEYRNNTWKQVFTSPQPMGQIFLAKFLNLHLLILVFLLSFNGFMGFTLLGVHFLDPSLNVFHNPFNWKSILSLNVNSYLAILAISALQFWMGLHFRNFIIPIGIGFAMWVVASMMTMELHMDEARYFPYAFSIYSVSSKFNDILPSIQFLSLGYAVVFLLLGFLDFRRRKVRG